jgi:biotin transporter BioY
MVTEWGWKAFEAGLFQFLFGDIFKIIVASLFVPAQWKFNINETPILQ